MYEPVLALHSLVRWIVILTGFFAAARGFAGWLGRKPWAPADHRAGVIFTIGLDTQILIGLLMYVLVSPITTAAFQNMSGAMQSSLVRFWLVEHPTAMLLALVLTHVGRARIKRTDHAALRHRRAAWFFGLALLLVLLGSPWPFMPVARPLWPL